MISRCEEAAFGPAPVKCTCNGGAAQGSCASGRQLRVSVLAAHHVHDEPVRGVQYRRSLHCLSSEVVVYRTRQLWSWIGASSRPRLFLVEASMVKEGLGLILIEEKNLMSWRCRFVPYSVGWWSFLEEQISQLIAASVVNEIIGRVKSKSYHFWTQMSNGGAGGSLCIRISSRDRSQALPNV